MKTFRIVGLTLLAMILCLSACSGGGDEPIEPTPKPEVIKSEITIDSSILSNGLSFTSEKGEKSVSFSTNENWTLSVAGTTSGATWCTPSATSGSKGNASVKFEVAENTSYDNRSVSVTIKSGSATKTFTISQKCADALLVTTDKYEVGQEGGTIDIEVKSNIDYKMEISEAAKDWIKESSSRGLTTYKHTLNISASEESEKREGEIYFKSGDKVETVKVYQAGGAIILLSQNEFNVSDKGGTISVDIKSNIDFDVQMPDVDWIVDESASRGLSSHTLKYTIAANKSHERKAQIIYYNKDKVNGTLADTLTIIQKSIDERDVLIDFYNATNGPHWVNNENWCSDKPIHEWYGISVTNNRVTRIQLPHNGLEGEIPESFFVMTDLEWINLEENNLYGDLSDKFGNISKCQFLGLARNNFTGVFPNTFINLVNLTYLSLYKNKLSGNFPMELMEMPNWDTVIKDCYIPQQIGYGFEWPATLQMIDLGDGIYMHPDGVALEYRVDKLNIPSGNEIFSICKNIYKKMRDSFDFIFLVCNSDQLSENLAGFHIGVKNEIKGIQNPLFDNSNDYGSQGKLKGVNVLIDKQSIYSGGPFLHELCHYWGAIDIGQEHGNSTGSYFDFAHWGITDIHGQLGGFDYSTLETNVDGNPNKYRASSYTSQILNNKKGFTQAGISNQAYAPLELYLMGLIPASEVPIIHSFQNVRTDNDTWDNGIFYAESQKTITINDIVEKYGERIPSWEKSQKDFRGLIVVLSDKKVSDYDWNIIRPDILMQELKKDDENNKRKNFWEATGGRATLTLSGIDQFLK